MRATAIAVVIVGMSCIWLFVAFSLLATLSDFMKTIGG